MGGGASVANSVGEKTASAATISNDDRVDDKGESERKKKMKKKKSKDGNHKASNVREEKEGKDNKADVIEKENDSKKKKKKHKKPSIDEIQRMHYEKAELKMNQYVDILETSLKHLHSKRRFVVNPHTAPWEDPSVSNEVNHEYRKSQIPVYVHVGDDGSTKIGSRVYVEDGTSIYKRPPRPIPIPLRIEDPVPGRYHNYCGWEKIFPLKSHPSTAQVFQLRNRTNPVRFPEDDLIKTSTLSKGEPLDLQEQIEKKKNIIRKAVCRRFKAGALSLSRSRVKKEMPGGNDDDTSTNIRYGDAQSTLGSINDDITTSINYSLIQKLKDGDEQNTRTRNTNVNDLHSMRNTMRESTSTPLISGNEVSVDTLEATRSDLLDITSMAAEPLVKVRMERHRKTKGLNKFRIKGLGESFNLFSLSSKTLRHEAIKQARLKVEINNQLKSLASANSSTLEM